MGPSGVYAFVCAYVVVFLSVLYCVRAAAGGKGWSASLTVSSAIQTNEFTYAVACVMISLLAASLVFFEVAFPAPHSAIALPLLLLASAFLISTASVTYDQNPKAHAGCAGMAILCMALTSAVWVADAGLSAAGKVAMFALFVINFVGFLVSFSLDLPSTAPFEWAAVALWLVALCLVAPRREASNPLPFLSLPRLASSCALDS